MQRVKETLVGGEYSHAEGYRCVVHASARYSHAEGQQTSCSSGNYAHAEGFQTVASGDGAHAEGYQTKAEGQSAHAEGRETTASADYSHAGGRGTNAAALYQTTVGLYNEIDPNAAIGPTGEVYPRTSFQVGGGFAHTARVSGFAAGQDIQAHPVIAGISSSLPFMKVPCEYYTSVAVGSVQDYTQGDVAMMAGGSSRIYGFRTCLPKIIC